MIRYEDFTEISPREPVLNFLKVCSCCNLIFGEETNVELLTI